jgi:hypothetical protein
MINDPQLSLITLSILLLFTGGILGIILERMLAAQRRKAWKEKNSWRKAWRPRRRWPTVERAGDRVLQPTPVSTKPTDSADQLRVVMGAEFLPQPLLNRSEARVFKELDQYVIATNPGWQVMAQVSLGEILSCENSDAYSCINSKRVDLLLVDDDCQPRHAVEYQGSGHHQSDAAARDAVKKEALRRAGIGYHEVLAGHTTPADLRRLVEKLVDRPGTLPPDRPAAEH